MVELRYEDDNGNSASLRLDEARPIVRVGRAKKCEIRTSNATVSGTHCEVALTDAGLTLTDLQSSNGTFHGRKRIRSTDLSDGDVFFCGNFAVTVVWTNEEAHTASRPVMEAVDGESTSLLGAMPSFDDVAEETPLPASYSGGSDEPPEEILESTRALSGLSADLHDADTSPGGSLEEREREEVTSLDVGIASFVALEGYDEFADMKAMPDPAPPRPETTVIHNMEDMEGAQRTLDIGVMLEDATSTIERLEAELDTARALLVEAPSPSPEKEERIAALERDLNQGQEDLKRSRDELGQTQEELEQARRERDFSRDELATVREERQSLDGELATARSALSQLEARGAEQEAEHTALEERLTAAQDELKQARQGASEAAEATEERCAALEAARDEHIAAAETASDRLAELEETLRRQQEQLEESEGALLEARETAQARASDLEGLQNQYQEIETELETTRTSLADVQEQAQEQRNLVAALTEEMEVQEAAHSDTEARASAAVEELNQTQEACEALRTELEEVRVAATASSGELGERLAELKDEVAKSRQRAQEAEDTLTAQTEAHDEALSAARDEATAALSQAEAALGDLELGQKSWAATEAELRAENQSLNEALSAAAQPSAVVELERLAQTSEEGRLEAMTNLAQAQDEASANLLRADTATARASELAETLAELTDAHEGATQEVSDLKQMLLGTVNSDEVEGLRNRIDELEREVHRVEAERERHISLAQDGADRLEAAEALGAEQTAAIAHLTDERDLLAKQIQGLEEDLQKARDQASTAIAKATGGEVAAAELEQAIQNRARAEEERDELQTKLEVVQAQHDALEAEVASRERSLKAAEKARDALETELTQLQEKSDSSVSDASEEIASLRETVASLRASASEAEVAMGELQGRLEAAERSADVRSMAQTEAEASRDQSAEALAALESEMEALRETSGTSASHASANLKSFRTAVHHIFEEINDQASEWKLGVSMLNGYFEDIQEGFADPDARDSTYEALRETLETLATSSADVKDRLKAVRKLLGD